MPLTQEKFEQLLNGTLAGDVESAYLLHHFIHAGDVSDPQQQRQITVRALAEMPRPGETPKNLQALTLLGTAYRRNYPGIERHLNRAQRLERAFELFQQARLWGESHAICSLGMMYKNGEHVACNRKIATEYFEQAEALNNPRAMFWLAYIYYEDDYGNKPIANNPKGRLQKIIELFDKAIMMGHKGAMINRGKFCEAGIGEPNNVPNLIRAKTLYQLAEDRESLHELGVGSTDNSIEMGSLQSDVLDESAPLLVDAGDAMTISLIPAETDSEVKEALLSLSNISLEFEKKPEEQAAHTMLLSIYNSVIDENVFWKARNQPTVITAIRTYLQEIAFVPTSDSQKLEAVRDIVRKHHLWAFLPLAKLFVSKTDLSEQLCLHIANRDSAELEKFAKKTAPQRQPTSSTATVLHVAEPLAVVDATPPDDSPNFKGIIQKVKPKQKLTSDQPTDTLRADGFEL